MMNPYLLCWVVTCLCANTVTADTRDRSFDADWRFLRGDVPDAQTQDFDDTAWRTLDVPHDWSIEDLDTPESIGPFSKESPGGASTGHVLGGMAWYRKHFILSEEDTGKQVALRFDGVYMDSEVWLNGRSLGQHPYGYTPFAFDLTPLLKPAGQTNVVAVRVRNLGKNSRWYSGSGIYRHVWLTVTDAVHIPLWGVFVTTPQASDTSASVHLAIDLANTGRQSVETSISTTLVSPDGKSVATITTQQTIAAHTEIPLKQTVILPSPKLWSLETPHLYEAVTEVRVRDTVMDRLVTPFGIRTIEFSAREGFKLNGQPVWLRGACVHHDNGPLGAAALDRAEVRRVEILKANGFNAIRTSHNPPSPAFLDACDRLGVLVIDEIFDHWKIAKNPQDYHRFFEAWWETDLTAMIHRDRNHPSVVLWSIGNEINERVEDEGLAITRQLCDAVQRLDPTRPTTESLCEFWERKNRSWPDTARAFELLDVAGYNYQWKQYEPDHTLYPDRIMVGSESFPREALENWQQVEQHPYVIGDFVWTGMDYLGESAIGHASVDNEPENGLLPWPWYVAYCGDIDICGHKKPQSYYRDVVWRQSPLEMAVHCPIPEGHTEIVSRWGWPDEVRHWTWPGQQGKAMQVHVYTRYPKVRLELNGRVMGTQSVSEDTKLTATFSVPYEPGTLRAVGMIDDQVVSSVTFQTTGQAVALRLTPDRSTIEAGRNDLAYVTVEIVDEHGSVVPHGISKVHFEITGPGELAAVANA
ncbi:MAG: DUF4982 domain-containing protein, partial [Phycisphaerae bacterium]|nr:DUF4982 domain-containing protein [Phycisphaerae bacterium]